MIRIVVFIRKLFLVRRVARVRAKNLRKAKVYRIYNWLSAYQNDREVALAKALEQSKVNLVRKEFSKVIELVSPKYETKFLCY